MTMSTFKLVFSAVTFLTVLNVTYSQENKTDVTRRPLAASTFQPLLDSNISQSRTEEPEKLNVTTTTIVKSTTTADQSNTDTSETPTTSETTASGTSTESATLSTEFPSSISTARPTIPTTTPTPFNHSEFVYGHYCTCDVTSDACDVNCCCDVDCSERDVKVFSNCLRAEVYNPDPRYCFKTDIVAENNTQYLIERRSSDRLFCISVDNLQEGFRYRDRDRVENVTDFLELTSRHKHYVRPDDRNFEIRLKSGNKTEPELDDEIETIELDDLTNYAFDDKWYLIGRPIWTYRRDLKAPGVLSMPTGRDCGSITPIRYGHDSEISCQRGPVFNCSQLSHVSASEFFDFSVIRSPALFRNRTDRFVEISVRVCTAKTCTDLHENGHGPIHQATSGCDNIVTSSHYVIVHDGIKGISSVSVTIELANYSSILESDQSPFFTQTFGYKHFWSSDNSTDMNKRSGNPGYQRGKPVLSGTLKKNETGLNWFIDREQEPFLKIMKTNVDCSTANPNDRLELKFGENVRSGCSYHLARLELSDECDVIKNQILRILTGFDADDLTQVAAAASNKGAKIGAKLLSDRRVAIFGNSQMSKPGDWVQVMISNFPAISVTSSKASHEDGVCKNMVTSLHIEIAYANAGSFANPQAKIVGVHYRFGRSEDVVFRCIGLACRLPTSKSLRVEVSTSVAFLDVTEPATEYYAAYPVIEARLPHDFFYPFVSSTPSTKISSAKCQILAIFVTVFWGIAEK